MEFNRVRVGRVIDRFEPRRIAAGKRILANGHHDINPRPAGRRGRLETLSGIIADLSMGLDTWCRSTRRVRGGRPVRRTMSATAAAVCTMGALFMTPSPSAAQTWDGGGSDDNWSTDANWDGDVAPPNGGADALIFTGTVRPSPIADTAWSLQSLTFDANATTPFAMSGETLTFAADGSIVNNSASTHAVANNLFAADVSGLTIMTDSGSLAMTGDINLDAGGGAALTVDGNFLLTLEGTIIGANATVTKRGSGILTLTGVNSYTGTTTVSDGTLIIAGLDDSAPLGASVGSIAGPVEITDGTVQVDGTINNDTTISGGTLTINNQVTGNVTVDGGILEFGDDNAVADGSDILITSNGGTLSATGGARTINNNLIVNGDFTLSGTSSLTLTSDIALPETRTINVLDPVADKTLSGNLSGVGGLVVGADGVGGGTGRLILSGVNTYEGGTTILSGTLVVEGSIVGDASVDGGRLQVDGVLGDPTDNNSVVTVNSGGLTVDTDGQVNGIATFIGGNSSINGTMTGGVTITAGTVEIDGAVGGANVSGGSLTVGPDGRVNGDATVTGGSTTVTGQITGDVTVSDTGLFTFGVDDAVAGQVLVEGGTLAASGGPRSVDNILINTDFTVGGTDVLTIENGFEVSAGRNSVTVEAGATADLAGTLTGTAQLNKAGTGRLLLSGANQISGPVRLVEGTLALGNDSALGSSTSLIIEEGSSIEAAGVARLINDAVTLTVNGDFSVAGTEDLTIQAGFDVMDGRTISVLNAGTTADLAGNLTGTGGLTHNGNGTLVLSGNNSFTGVTTVNTGSLVLSGSVAGDAAAAGGVFDVTRFGSVAGQALVTGGTMNIDGEVTADASVTSGTLNVRGVVMGSATVNSGGVLGLGADDAVRGGIIVETGAEIQAIDGARSVDNELTINGDFSITGSEDLTINSTIDLLQNHTVTVDGSGLNPVTAEFAGVVQGTSGLTKAGNDTLVLSADNTYSGDTILAAGVLEITGSVVGDVLVNGGQLNLLRPQSPQDTVPPASHVRVMGNLETAGGTVAFGSNDAVMGALTLGGGVNLQAAQSALDQPEDAQPGDDPVVRTITNALVIDGNFGVSGNEALNLAGDGQLNAVREVAITNTAETEFSGVWSGAGGLTKTGAGTLVLSHEMNAYEGATSIEEGILILEGAVAGDVVVGGVGSVSGPTAPLLTGQGTIGGDLTVAVNGVINAGNLSEAGNMTIQGNLQMDGSATTVVDIASPTSVDHYAVTGSAAVDGALFVVALEGYSPRNNQEFVIITAEGGIIAADSENPFSQEIPLNAAFEFNTRVDGNNVVVTIEGVPFADTAATDNQRGVAAVLDSIRPASDDDESDSATVIGQLDTLSDIQLRGALDQITAEEIGALSNISFASASGHNRNITNRLAEVRLGYHGSSARHLRLGFLSDDPDQDLEMKAAVQDEPWRNRRRRSRRQQQEKLNFFVAGAGTLGEVDGTSDTAGYDFVTGQITLGMDGRLTRNMVGGVVLGYDRSNVDVDSDGGEVDVNSVRFGVYGTLYGKLFNHMAYLNGFLGGGYHLYDSDRNIRFGTINRTASSDPEGWELDGAIAGGFEIPFKDSPWNLYPEVSLAYSRLEIDGYTESGAGSLNLDVDDQTANSLLIRVGARLSALYDIGEVTMIPEVRVMYQHEVKDQDRSITARFASGGGGTFAFDTTDVGEHAVVLGVGTTFVNENGASVYVDYSTELGRTDYIAHNVRVGVQFSF